MKNRKLPEIKPGNAIDQVPLLAASSQRYSGRTGITRVWLQIEGLLPDVKFCKMKFNNFTGNKDVVL